MDKNKEMIAIVVVIDDNTVLQIVGAAVAERTLRGLGGTTMISFCWR